MTSKSKNKKIVRSAEDDIKAELEIMTNLEYNLHGDEDMPIFSIGKKNRNPNLKEGRSSGKTENEVYATSKMSIQELEKIVRQAAFSSEERYKVLDARDRLMRARRNKSRLMNGPTGIRGVCPDMCPEKERLMRESQRQVAPYELLEGVTDYQIDHGIAVKQYSRSSADQEEPVPQDLRPVKSLKMTMSYLLHEIADLCQRSGTNLAEWYHFLWDRTRAIRKDITQQELCCLDSVELVQQCARFHIVCAERLCAEESCVFDKKINTENLTKCLQTLKYMYHDLRVKGIVCDNEPEFRAYIILLNLNNGNFMWDIQRLEPSVRKSPQVRFAVDVYISIQSNNYARFFRLVRETNYLNACILLRYFNQVRVKALAVMVKAYCRTTSTAFPLYELLDILGFEDENEAILFCQQVGLRLSNDELHVMLNRRDFCQPEVNIEQGRACNYVESKRVASNSSIGLCIAGKRMPEKLYLHHKPHDSFDSRGYLISTDPQIHPEEDTEIIVDDDAEIMADEDADIMADEDAEITADEDAEMVMEENAEMMVEEEEEDAIEDKVPEMPIPQNTSIFMSKMTSPNTMPSSSVPPSFVPPSFIPPSFVPPKFVSPKFSPPRAVLMSQQSPSTLFSSRTLSHRDREKTEHKVFPTERIEPVQTSSNDSYRVLKKEEEEKKVLKEKMERRVEEESEKMYEQLVEETIEELIENIIQEENENLVDETSREIMDELLDEVVEEVSKDVLNRESYVERRVDELSRRAMKRRMLKYYRIWRDASIRKKQQRDALDATPVWLQKESVEECAKRLYRSNQGLAIANMSARKRLKRNTGDEERLDYLEPIELKVYEGIRENARTLQIDPSSNCYWKMMISWPLGNEAILSRYRKIINQYISPSDCTSPVLVKSFKPNSYETVNICIQHVEGPASRVIGTDGLLFVATGGPDEARLDNTISSRRKLQPIPVFVLAISPRRINLDRRLDRFVESGYVSEYAIRELRVLDERTILESIQEAIVWLTVNKSPPVPLEMDYLAKVVDASLTEELWLRILGHSSFNRHLKRALREPKFVIELHNEAVARLLDIFLDPESLEYTDFPPEFEKMPRRLPCGYENFDSDWKKNVPRIEQTMRRLLLPRWPSDWAVDQESILRYCQSLDVVVSYPYDKTDSLIQIFLEIVKERIGRLEPLTTVIYNKNHLGHLRNLPWWFESRTLAGYYKRVAVEEEEEEKENQSRNEMIIDEDNDDEKTLRDFEEKEEIDRVVVENYKKIVEPHVVSSRRALELREMTKELETRLLQQEVRRRSFEKKLSLALGET